MRAIKRIISLLLSFVIIISVISVPSVARAYTLIDLMADSVKDWASGISGQNTGIWNPIDPLSGMLTGVNRPAASSKPQNYYTTPTSSVQDKNGNVTNYYRGGDTTNTKIIDSYNKTFNTIHNTTNNTNNYKANVRLSDFLNNYTTNNITNTTNNQYTYSADFNTWLKCTQCQGQIEIQIKR